MGFDRLRIKSNARLFYKNNTGMSIVVPLIQMMITGAASIAAYIIISVFAVVTAKDSGVVTAMTLLTYPVIIIANLAAAPIMIGTMGWFRKSIYYNTSVSEVFAYYGNGRLWSSVGTVFLMGLYIYLWSLLFLIPGIIKGYSYSQTLFIKAENPDIPASRAIELSKIMMEGHKWDMFVLHCSFLGWLLLSAITYNIVGIVYVYPYYYAAMAFAYEEIKMDAASRGVINIAEIMGDAVPMQQ